MDTTKKAKNLINQEKYDKALKMLELEIKKFGKTKPEKLKGDDQKKLLRFLQLKANALSRRGQLRNAQEILEDLVKGGFKDSETLGMYARTYKDCYYRSGKRSDLLKSRDLYAKSFMSEDHDLNVDGAAYVGINAAAMSVLLGENARAVEYSNALTKAIEKKDKKDYWLAATVAEAELIRAIYTTKKDKNAAFERAAELYGLAVNGSPKARGSHGSTWLQAKRLMRAMKVSKKHADLIRFAFRHLTDDAPSEDVLEPPYRRLRVYAFDPNWAKQLNTAAVNELTIKVAWEERYDKDEKGNPTGSPHLRGPVGEYFEIVDIDPASGCTYEPIDLNDRRLLAMDGKAPSVGDPQFHQQMVYAVGMDVIANFERALGRRALWSNRKIRDERGNVKKEHFVQRLRVYPHGLREANAYYSPIKKALLFGYFPAEADDPLLLPGGTVFTCLSHDIIAHEMTHALMDGLHPRFAEATNVDVLAFHEAFADIVALFQHFSHPEVLRHEVSRTRGQLSVNTHLGQLAQEFGRAIGRRGALRDAIGKRDENEQWQRHKPNPDDLIVAREPHDRGAILVAAVFDAFLAIYETRTRDLLRIATQGSGVLAPGEIHPDLVDRLAREAAKAAKQILHICIRALDYCPPLDITFGDYLRAMITADVDAVPNDKYGYRLALIESFHRRGIYPQDARNLSVESLIWRPPRGDRIDMSEIFSNSRGKSAVKPEWRSTGTRRELYDTMKMNAVVMHGWLMNRCPPEVADEIGLHLETDAPASFYFRRKRPTAEVHSVRVAQKMTPDGSMHTDLVVEIMQRRRGYFNLDKQKEVDEGSGKLSMTDKGDFTFRGGCTLLIDPADGRVRYAINKHILSNNRLQRQRDFLSGAESNGRSLRATYFGDERQEISMDEPFAVLHRSQEI